MTKKEAIALFGKRHEDLATAINRCRSLITQWADELNEDQANMVIGAYVRKTKKLPRHLL